MNRPRKRTRLTAEVRRAQILDAALVEFSAHGFEGATMDQIAQRTGITKAGIYAHFKSKETVFEALLVSNIFEQPIRAYWHWQEGDSLEQTVDRYLDAVYQRILEPRVQATFRLLVAESGRVPERIRRWRTEIFQPYAMRRQRQLDTCIARGLLPDNVFSRTFSIVSAPTVMALLSQLFAGAGGGEAELTAIRDVHRQMLLTLLRAKDGQ